MRSYVVLAAVLAGLLIAPSAQAAALFKSANVTELGTLPEAVGAIGARFSPDGDTMYVTSATGLGIYDVSRPEAPQRLSRLPLPHFENEDVDVGHIDGRDYVIITNDPSFTGVGVIYVIDVTDPARRRWPARPRSRSPGSTASSDTPGPATATSPTASRAAATCGRPAPRRASRSSTSRDPTQAEYLGASRCPAAASPTTSTIDAHRHRMGHRRGRDVRLRRTRCRPAGAALLATAATRRSRTPATAGRRRPGSANGSPLDFLHHNSHAHRARPARGHRGGLPASRLRGPGLAADLADHRRAQRRRHDQARSCSTCGRPSSTSSATQRSAARRPRSTARRTGSTSPAALAQGWYDQGVRFLDISRSGATSSRSATTSTSGDVLGRVLRADRSRRTRSSTRSTSPAAIDVLQIDRSGGAAPRCARLRARSPAPGR